MSVAAQPTIQVLYKFVRSKLKKERSRSNKCHSELVSESLTNIIFLPRGRVKERVKRY